MNNPHIFALTEIQKSIEFCMKNGIHEDPSIDPQIIEAMAFLHQAIEHIGESK